MGRTPAFHSHCTGLLSLFAAVCVFPSIVGAWPDDLGQNVPLCTAAGPQEYPQMAADGLNGAIAVWTDIRSGRYDVFAQRLLADGTPVWGQNGVSICDAIGDQAVPRICTDQQGGAIIVWGDARSEQDIFAQRVGPDGAAAWASIGLPVCVVPGFQWEPAIASDGVGGALIVWQDARSGGWDIYAQRLSPAGLALWATDGVAVCIAPNSQTFPVVIPDGGGGAIVVWDDYRFGSSDCFAQKLAPDGQVLWTANGVAVRLALAASHEKVGVSDGSGGAFLAWQDNQLGDWDVFAQRISASGELLWPTNATRVCAIDAVKAHPSIAPDGLGGVVIVWDDQRGGTNSDIYGQRLSPDGNPYWDQSGRPICVAERGQWGPVVVSTGIEGSVVTWTDSRTGQAGTFAQWVSSSGDALWGLGARALSTAPGSQQFQTAVVSGSSAVIVAWQDYRNGAPDIYADRVLLDLPTGVAVSVLEGRWEPNGVRLAWQASCGAGVAFAVYRRCRDQDWMRLGNARVDGTGKVEFLDEDVQPGVTLGYRLGIIEDSEATYAGEVWVEVPVSRVALRVGAQSPAEGGNFLVKFALLDASPARLDLIDLAGRLLASKEVGALGPGTHILDLSERVSRTAGVYFLRLRQGGAEVKARVAVVD